MAQAGSRCGSWIVSTPETRAKDCATLEELFQEVADLPDADELLTYVDRWGVHTECFKDE
jgi:hypothetical protein